MSLAQSSCGALARSVPVGPLPFADTVEYLTRRGLSTARAEALAEETRGHPLAASLLAEVVLRDPGAPIRLAANVPVVASLVERLLAPPTAPRLATALHACAVALYATEPLLSATLDVDEDAARAIFEELRRLSFVEIQPRACSSTTACAASWLRIWPGARRSDARSWPAAPRATCCPVATTPPRPRRRRASASSST